MEQETQQISALAQSSPVAVQLEKPFTAEVGYQYDADGRLAKLTYPDQTTVAYRYNERGELNKVEDAMTSSPGSKPGTARYTRRPDGKITQLALPNGTVTTKSYDGVGRLSEIKHLDPAGKVLFSEASRYDQRNRRTARVQADGSADLFAYDPAGQVTAAAYGQAWRGDDSSSLPTTGAAATSPTKNEEPGTKNSVPQKFTPTQTFAYDPAGNRLEVTDNDTTIKYTPNAANQYTQVTTGTQIVEPQFDKLGNLLHDDKNIYTWDADIHLLSVVSKAEMGRQKAEIKESYRYDALHRRAARHESATNTTTLFIMDGWNVIAEYEATHTANRPQLTAQRVWSEDLSGTLQGAGGIGGLLSSLQQPSTTVSERKLPSTSPCWFSYDSNGNVIFLTDAQGKESARYRYDAFGKTILAQGPAALSSRYRFSTKPVEAGSGLAFYGYRYYSPELGRWPSKDPIGERGGANLYGMLNNNALIKADKLGLVGLFLMCIAPPTPTCQVCYFNSWGHLEVRLNCPIVGAPRTYGFGPDPDDLLGWPFSCGGKYYSTYGPTNGVALGCFDVTSEQAAAIALEFSNLENSQPDSYAVFTNNCYQAPVSALESAMGKDELWNAGGSVFNRPNE